MMIIILFSEILSFTQKLQIYISQFFFDSAMTRNFMAIILCLNLLKLQLQAADFN